MDNHKNIFAFIFARGGSKGIPLKNIALVDSKPLVQHSIEIAKEIDEVQKIFVSTDSDKIKEIALQNKVEVIDRPAELATDNSAEWLSWQHAIKYTIKNYGDFKKFPEPSPTSPLRNKK